MKTTVIWKNVLILLAGFAACVFSVWALFFLLGGA